MAVSTWLGMLALELDDINDSNLIDPVNVMAPTDTKIGEMSIISKKLFTLGERMEKEAQQCFLGLKFCHDKDQRKVLEAKANEYTFKAQAIKLIMWISVRDEYGLWSDNVGVRENWTVVTRPEDTNDIPPFLRFP